MNIFYLSKKKPISFMGELHKLLAKVVANRLKEVMEKVVSASQHAFVESKQIIVVFFIANEPINTRLKSSKSEIPCKLDMKKACDHLN